MGQEACGEGGAAANNVLRPKDICVTMEVTSMKKSTKRFLSSVLVFLVMLSTMVMSVSAATVEWTNSDGTYNYATVTKTSDWYYVYKEIEGATIVRHAVGTGELITWPVGNTATYRVQINVSAYGARVNQALAAEGLTEQVDGEAVENDEGYYIVPENVPAGTYSFGYEIKVYDISWSVVLNCVQFGPTGYALPTGNQSGTVDAVPEYITEAKLIPVA